MSYPDGHNPPDSILNEFLELSLQTEGALAVHCMAGLGYLPLFALIYSFSTQGSVHERSLLVHR